MIRKLALYEKKKNSQKHGSCISPKEQVCKITTITNVV